MYNLISWLTNKYATIKVKGKKVGTLFLDSRFFYSRFVSCFEDAFTIHNPKRKKKQEGPAPVCKAARFVWGWLLLRGESKVPPYFVGFTHHLKIFILSKRRKELVMQLTWPVANYIWNNLKGINLLTTRGKIVNTI